jgi:hypothetical protein
MRKKLIVALVLLNALLAGAFLAVPADTQIIPRGIRNCCQSDGPGDRYCCRGCCWFTFNCFSDQDCGAVETSVGVP